MKFIKKIPTILLIIIPIILVVAFAYLLYASDKKMVRLKQGIDLEPRPFLELLEMDFAKVGNVSIQDPSKCSSTKVLEQIKQFSSNPEIDGWKNYDANIYKLNILDDCWRQYENEYLKVRFRDLNDSLIMSRVGVFSVDEPNSRTFWIATSDKNNQSYFDAIMAYSGKYQDFHSLKVFKNPNGLEIYRLEIGYNSYKYTKKNFYLIDIPKSDNYITISSDSNRILKEILSSIELK